MNIEKIYFDLDGVLADFDSAVKHLGATQYPIGDEIWEKLKNEKNFFQKINVMENAHLLFDIVYSKYKNKVEILTGIPQPKREMFSAADDKRQWVYDNFTKNIVVNTVYRAEKKNFCLGKEYVLIDDMKRTIKEWNKKGGVGILHISVENTIKQMKELGIL